MISDFMEDFELLPALPDSRRVAFFPGSTIGNLDVEGAGAFLQRMRRHVGSEGATIVGFDLKKETNMVLAASDDAQEITAQFNLILLVRINRELGGDLALGRFWHSVRWNDIESAVAMVLVSQTAQTVIVGDRRFDFHAGETVRTKSSRKYSPQGFAALAAASGWRVEHVWTDQQKPFGVVRMR